MRRIIRSIVPAAALLAAITLSAGEIHHAARDGQLQTAQTLLQNNPELLADRDDQLMTPLHWAAYEGHHDVVAYLIDKGADVNVQKDNLSTPLHGAAYHGHLAVVKLLLERNAASDGKNEMGYTPLLSASAAGHAEIVKLLLDRGADHAVATDYAGTPLSAATFGGHTAVVRHLIAAGADVNASDSRGTVPLHMAVIIDSDEILRLLIANGANTEVTDAGGGTPLLWAARAGQVACVETLLEMGANINQANNEGFTPLSISLTEGKAEMVKLLVARGADLNTREKRTGRTPLHLAAISGDYHTLNVLLAAGGEAEAVDDAGCSPIQYAAKYGHKDITDLLRARGARADNLQENYGYAGDLSETLENGDAVMWYLGHCGWAIKTAHHLLIFDYYNRGTNPTNPLLANGHINTDEIAGLNVTVFVTHEHEDHFDTTILGWQDAIANLTYVFGFRPEETGSFAESGYNGPAYEYFGPRTTGQLGGVEITTIEANDAGVGFLVKADGLTLYHAGDHAGWNEGQKEGYKREIDFLAEQAGSVDLAFLNITGCHCRDTVALMQGNLYTIERLAPAVMIPTHASGREYLYREVTARPEIANLKLDVICAGCRGDRFRYVGGRVL
jgi:ankyrin repeat protein/L-ascorbate metabolism protein UlaG (beta-lactamase superfamily)